MTQHINPQRVVVPVDDPIDRQQAVAIGSELGRRLGVPVDIVTVADPMDDKARPPSIATPTSHVVNARLVQSHSVDRALRDFTRTAGTLMCLPSTGRRSLSEMIRGSTSATILHDVRVPLVVVGPHCDDALEGKILAIAVDGSEGGTSVIEPALDLAVALGLMPMLYQVVGEGTQADLIDSSEVGYLAGLAEAHARAGLDLGYEVLHDRHVARALSRLTEDDDVAMIALASHGQAANERVVISSVVHEVIRRSRCPVLLAPRPSSSRHVDLGHGSRVVVGVDGSPADHGPLAVAADEAARRGARLEIVHAWTRSWVVVEGGVAADGDADLAIANAREVMKIAVLKAKALAPDIEIIEWIVERGSIDALLDAAWDAELIVVGERRHRRLDRWMLGSTTEAIIHRSPVPIIVVPEWTETKFAVAADREASGAV